MRDQWRNDYRAATTEVRWGVLHAIWKAWPLLLLLAVFSVAGSGLWWLRTAGMRVAGPDAAITNYEWFEQRVQDIEATRGMVADAEQSLGRAQTAAQNDGRDPTFLDAQELGRLQDNVQGLRQHLRTQRSEYNARSRQITRNLWKSDDLPYEIKE